MTDADDTTRLQEQLRAHRATLAVLLRQLASLGADHAPPGVHNGIAEARSEIARLKTQLRTAGVAVVDQAGDEANESAGSEFERSRTLHGDTVAGDLIDARGSLGFVNRPSDPVTQHFNILRQPRPTIDLAQAQQLLDRMPFDTVPDLATLPSGSRMPLRRNPLFIGREDDLRIIAAALKASSVAAITTGIGGVGKTQLASEFAHRYGQFFAGGVFWLSFADPTGVESEISACGGAGALELYTDADGLSQAEQVAKVVAAWGLELPRLLIFDNCDDTPGMTAEQLLVDRLPSSGGCRVLVTSRRGQWRTSLGVIAHHLDTLPRAESIALLRSHHADLSDVDADAIADTLGDLPLALSLAGSFLDTYRDTAFGQPAAYLANLQKQLLDHRSLAQGDPLSPTQRELGVRAAFDLSYQQLQPSDPIDALAITALARAACLAPGEPFPRELLLATVTTEQSEEAHLLALDAVFRLIDLGLVERVGDAILRIHRLIAAYVNSVPNDGASEAIEHALIDMVYRINELGYPKTMAPLLAHLRYTLTRAEKTQRDDAGFAKLLMQMGYYLNTCGDYPAALSLYQRANTINKRVLGSTHPQTVVSLNNLAALYRSTENYTTALSLYECAFTISEQTFGATHPQTAAILNNLAALYRATGNDTAAFQLYERALTISEQIHGASHPYTAISLNNLAALHQSTGDYTTALQQYLRAFAINEQKLGPTHPQTAISLNNLAALHQSTGDYTAALHLYLRALTINVQTLGLTHPQTATSLDNLAALYGDMGNYVPAHLLPERALALDPNHPQTAMNLSNLAINAFLQGQPLRAQVWMQWALHILETSVDSEYPDTFAARQSLAFIRQFLIDPLIVFTPLLNAIAAVAAGSEAQRTDTEDTLKMFERQGWHIHAAVQHLWAGERNVQVLTASLDDQDVELIRRVLAILPPSSQALL